MEIKNILICADYLFNEVSGGAARVAFELAKNLYNKNYNVILLIRGRKKTVDFEILNSIEIYRYKDNFLNVWKILNYLFSNKKIDIVSLHDPYTSFFVIIYTILNSIKIPKVYIFNSPWGTEYYIRATRKCKFFLLKFIGTHLRIEIEKFILRYSNKVVCASNYMADELFRIHKIRSEIIPLGVDIDKFKPINESKIKLRKKIGINFDGKVIFTLRNLEPRMGLENLIDAANIIKMKGYKNILFILGGDGSLYSELCEKIKAGKLERMVTLIGHVPDEILPFYYNASDVFVLPTKELEGFGLVSLEAMACGIPVLATPVAANVEVIGNFDKSFLFNGCSSNDIAEGIIQFLNRRDLTDIRDKMRGYAENFSWQKYGNEIERVFYEMSCL